MKDRLLPLQYVLLVLFSLVIFTPLAIVFFGAFKTSGELFNNPYSFPGKPVFENFKEALIQGNMLIYFKNSFIISFVSLAVILLFSTLSSYAITRQGFRMGNKIYIYFVFGIIVPSQAVMIPTYIMMARLGLVNTMWSVIIIYIATTMGFSIFILSGFFRTIPRELDEAAVIDGCNEIQAFWKVILPLCKPAVTTVLILNLLTIWNDFYNPLLYIRSEDIKTLSLGLSKYMGRYITNYPIMFAAVVMASLPVIAVFVGLQKQFVSGITAGSVKG
ncbi:carbohydrate ABC transporter permease [Paenibacillus segetis]|uniref:Sugar ABC transporter permease n=1 Tax=Paenibacillus segetis TaxID=1325360 RepID=A0ABQ1Y437_9BACL|nr:carbohydrate ABC transporter permease [Paenibacillus segetis]GGH11986.1 sugar ABC transporter permease [Paenibacillus segetis]